MKVTGKKYRMIFLLGAVLACYSFAFTPEEGKIVQETRYKTGTTEFLHLPDTPLNAEIKNSWKNAEEPSFMAEILYSIPKEALGLDSGNCIELSSKIIRSASKMQGVTYYSRREKKEKVLYKSAYTIKGPGDRTKIPDQTEGSADGKVIYVFQDDNSFGKIDYKISYRQTEKEVGAEFINITPLYVGPIKAVAENMLLVNFVITDLGDNLMIYMTVRSKFPAISFLESTMNETFISRLDAIYKWFISQF